MTDPVNDLVPMLKDYLDISHADREHTKNLIDKLEKTTEAMREYSVTMQLQLKGLEVQSAALQENCRDKRGETARKLEKMPSKATVDALYADVTEFKKLIPRIYTAVAVCTGIGGLVGLALAFVFKRVVG